MLPIRMRQAKTYFGNQSSRVRVSSSYTRLQRVSTLTVSERGPFLDVGQNLTSEDGPRTERINNL